MSTALRYITIFTALALIALLFTPVMHGATPAARPQNGGPEALLLESANRERASAGLQPLQWDLSLANAARQHAITMAQANTLSHQLPGELPLQQRATQSGARFSIVAENVAEGPNAYGLHTQWMNSAPHRANLLATDLNAVGIAVVQSGNILFAVEDFSQAIPVLSLDVQEMQVGSQLSTRGVHLVRATQEARKTCEMDRGWTGPRPSSVLRYETADLARLPEEIDQKVQSARFHGAAVGACDAGYAAGFTRFRIAILLY